MESTLGNVISVLESNISEPYEIMYRTKIPSGEDVFVGACKYENGALTPLDGDVYSLEDKIYDWEFTECKSDPYKVIITVWYESKWI